VQVHSRAPRIEHFGGVLALDTKHERHALAANRTGEDLHAVETLFLR
jgi:hypothetical protein